MDNNKISGLSNNDVKESGKDENYPAIWPSIYMGNVSNNGLQL